LDRGDIVLARFPFTDGSGTRLRPVLVLAEIPGAYPDFIVLFISSQLHQATPGVDLVLDSTHQAFATSGLKVPSVIRIGKVASLSSGLMVGPPGHFELTGFNEVVRRLVRLIESGHYL
jgi:mRNA interferase MazF